MKMSLNKIGIFTCIFLMFAGLGSSEIVINSQDWTDVQAGMQYADYVGEDAYFTRTSDGSGVLSDLPAGSNVTILQSSEDAYLENLDSQIQTRDYNYRETITFESENELIPDDINNYVVITERRPSDVVPAAPLADTLDAWVVVADGENPQELESQISGADQVVKIGQFRDSLDNLVSEYQTEEISASNRFGLSTMIADRVSEETDVSSVKIADGNYLETSMFADETPVLLTATNSLSSEIEDYLMDKESINGAIMIGAELGTVGEELNTAAEENNRNLSVFVKYGQATMGGSREVGALPLFSLPTPSMDLRISAAQYAPEQNRFLVTVRNPSQIDGYLLNSVVIKDREGDTVATAGDDGPQYISSDTSQVFSYEVNMTEETASSSRAEFTTSYGNNEDNLDAYVASQRENVFGPPRILPVSIIELQDNSNLNVTQVVYDEQNEGFNVTVSNQNTQAYARLNVQNVSVDGISSSFASDLTRLEPNETREIFIPAGLSEQDLIEMSNVEVNARYGEREDFLVNIERDIAQINFNQDQSSEGIPSSYIILILIISMLIGYLVTR